MTVDSQDDFRNKINTIENIYRQALVKLDELNKNKLALIAKYFRQDNELKISEILKDIKDN